jgi:hypothetical protein
MAEKETICHRLGEMGKEAGNPVEDWGVRDRPGFVSVALNRKSSGKLLKSFHAGGAVKDVRTWLGLVVEPEKKTGKGRH